MTYSSLSGSGSYSAASASQESAGRPGYAVRREEPAYGSRGTPDITPRSSYGPDRADGIGRQTAPDHSWYQSGSGNPAYQAGVNKVASAYMKTPTCGKFKPVNNLLL